MVSVARRQLGSRGEQTAVDHLVAMGYQPVARNYRCPYGEIDFIAEQAGCLVFVEIRSRRNQPEGIASESVGARKQLRMARAAAFYLGEHGLWDRRCRFDVVEVAMNNGAPVAVRVLQDAFEVPTDAGIS
jgi:putative endonuclease